MARFHEIAQWLLSSLGIALLILSLVIVPTNAVWGQTGGGCDDNGCGKCMPDNGACGPKASCPCMGGGSCGCGIARGGASCICASD